MGSVILAAATAGAATVTNFNPAGIGNGGSINLTSAGTVGWAAWDLGDGVNNGTTSYAANFTKAGSTVIYSSISRSTGTGGVRGPATDNSSQVYSWTAADATGNAANPADNRLSGVFSSTLNTAGQGVQFSISNLAALSAGQSYLVTLYAYSYGGQSQATATIGSSQANQLSLNTSAVVRSPELYQFVYNPDSTADALLLSYALTTPVDGFSHAGIQAVSISIIPEASSAAMVLVGATALLVRRQRR